MDIAVVGAGITGCLIAATLQKQGHKISVFEKSRGRGGRATCKRTHWGQFDLGAPFIRPTDPLVTEHLTELEQQGVARRWLVTPYKKQQTLQADKDNTPVYVLTPGMNAACHFWLQGCRLATSTRITYLQNSAGKWLLWDESQCKFGLFDWVIVTAPWPQSHALLAPHVCLPAFEETHWLPCWTVAAQLQTALPDVMPIIYPSDSILQLAVLDSAKPLRQGHSQIWTMQLTHQASNAMRELSSTVIARTALMALASLFERDAVDSLQCYQHFWRYARLAPDAPRPSSVWAPELGLAATGDWALGGSVESAMRAAVQFCQQFTDNFCYAQSRSG
ncbi:NAD(P)/FAD-dependent oxidoreductase [Bowmanella denitrificans]|uniref:NAD(P)/FAD-dependent oxidoreductase n=1 Tax=Bowmanella denitrificans TaxID=366582 RepID=UPI000C9CFFF9|nr:FAD-dependent oxidoreductase [Bowmanella denitrificans]